MEEPGAFKGDSPCLEADLEAVTNSEELTKMRYFKGK